MQMQTAFARSLRALDGDRLGGPVWAIVLGLAVLGVAVAWAFAVRVPLYEVSQEARLEAGQAAYAVQSPETGKVVQSHLAAGRTVEQGSVLVELDARADELSLGEQRVRLDAIGPEMAALQRQLETEERNRSQEQAATQAAIEENTRRRDEVEVTARHAEAEEHRLRALEVEGLIASRDYQSGLAEALRWRAAVGTTEAASERLRLEQKTRDGERNARLEKIRTDISQLEAARAMLQASIPSLEYAVERHKIRAPVGGRIAEAKVLRTLSVIAEGEQLASIIPSDHLTIVAQFSAAAALGRLRPGQPARMRLEGYPWAEFGTIEGRVTRVAGEVRHDSVRVDVDLNSGTPSAIPLSHGMPGAVEIEVERLSPAALLLRVAGQVIASPREPWRR